ncbi:MAG: hypothetical protein LBF87_01850, partial [Treponema sp.]|nr:hypothetical protein [Treponema sp.]
TQEEKTVRIGHRMDANIREYVISLKKIRVHSRNSMIFFFPARKVSYKLAMRRGDYVKDYVYGCGQRSICPQCRRLYVFSGSARQRDCATILMGMASTKRSHSQRH